MSAIFVAEVSTEQALGDLVPKIPKAHQALARSLDAASAIFVLRVLEHGFNSHNLLHRMHWHCLNMNHESPMYAPVCVLQQHRSTCCQ